jgi:PAS domain S-box-containing protein
VLIATVRALLRLYQAVSERKQARAALQQSEQTFRALFENAMDAILIADNEARYVDANPAACALMGMPREVLLGASLEELIRPEARSAARSQWAKFLEEGRQEGVFELIPADGTVRQVEFRARAHFLPNLHLSVLRDITERTRTEEELLESHRQLRELSNHLQGVREEERARIAREVHDELGQALTGLKLEIAAIVQRLSARNRTLIPRLRSMSDVVDGTIQSVRRISTELRPVILDELGLVPAIEWFAAGWQRRTGIACGVSVTQPEEYLPPDISVALFRIVQEALTNVVRHAEATQVSLELHQTANSLTLTIRDDGTGIGAERIRDRKSVGLSGMRERAAALGGELTISTASGQGTTIMVSIPLKGDDRTNAPGTE